LVYWPDGSCHENCPLGYWVDRGICVPCHDSCKTCSGSLEFDCLSCKSEFEVLSDFGSCVDCTDPTNTMIACEFVLDFALVEDKKTADIFSSNSIEIFFEDGLKYTEYFKSLDLNELDQKLEVKNI
jgi:hypothetical protein